MDRPQAQGRTLEDNAQVRITEWRFAPQAETGWHTHAMDYVVVYRTAGQHMVQTEDGTREVAVHEGQSYFRPAGMRHNVVNAGTQEIVLVEIELKPRP